MNYKIQRGDTLGSLAKRFGTSVDVLAKANKISNANQIRAGAQLTIPDRFERHAAHSRADARDGFQATAPRTQSQPAQVSEPRFPDQNATEEDLGQYQQDLARFAATQPKSPAQLSGVTAPAFPGPNATIADKTRFQADQQKYISALQAKGLQAPANFTMPSAPGPNATIGELMKYANDVNTFASAMQPRAQAQAQATATVTSPATAAAAMPAAPASSGGGIEDRALAGLSALKEPKDPGANASEADLAKYQRDLGKYNRMFEMYSKIMANAHEMKKSLISNMPR